MSEKDLARILALYREIGKKKESRLRYGIPYLAVYEIADQFFCEKQVEISREQEEIETESAKMGKAFHESLSVGTMVEVKQGWSEILSGKPMLVEVRLVGKWRGTLMSGRPDWVFFEDAKPRWLFEFKFTGMRIPSDSSQVQVRLYSLLLKLMGLDTSALKCAIVLVNNESQQSESWKRNTFMKIMRSGASKEIAVIKIENGRAFLRRPDIQKAERELAFAMGFWKRERRAIPTKNPSKCRGCKYNNVCDTRLA